MQKGKVIGINGTNVTVGFEDGKFKEFNLNTFNFTPSIGDQIEIFSNGEQIIINKTAGSNSSFNDINVDNIVNSFSSNAKKHRANKVIYIVLAIFFGYFGAHKFLVGQNGWGICFLVITLLTLIPFLNILAFIPAIIVYITSIIQAIIALFKPSDAEGYIYFD